MGVRLHALKLAKCRVSLPNVVSNYDSLAFGAPSNSLNQEPSLFPENCLSSKLLDYFSFSVFQAPGKARVVALSTCVRVYVLLKQIYLESLEL